MNKREKNPERAAALLMCIAEALRNEPVAGGGIDAETAGLVERLDQMAAQLLVTRRWPSAARSRSAVGHGIQRLAA